MKQKQLILASGSPRRRELLSRLGLPFTVQPADADETLLPSAAAEEQVLHLSQIKAAAVHLTEDAVILSADTIVVLDGAILGKPKDVQDARTMLTALSGRRHQVLTGVTVRTLHDTVSHCEKTDVWFRTLCSAEIDAYIATGDPMDKAGAYGVQGYASAFVSRIEGDFYNVMGLPLCRTTQMLRDAGIPVLGIPA